MSLYDKMVYHYSNLTENVPKGPSDKRSGIVQVIARRRYLSQLWNRLQNVDNTTRIET